MTKKKKKKPSGKRKVGKAGGSKSDDLMVAVGVIGGAIAARWGTNKLKTQFADLDPALVAGIPAAAGAVGLLAKGKVKLLRHPVLKGVSYGLLAGGAVEVAKELKIVGELAPPIYMDRRRIAGPNQLPNVGQSINPNLPFTNTPIVGDAIGMNRRSRRFAGGM